MTGEQVQQLRRYYELQAEALRLDDTARELTLQWETARGKQIECQEKLMNYETFSVKSILDRIKGRYTDQLEQYSRELRQADAEQKAAKRDLELLKEKQKQNRENLDQLPPEEAIRSWMGEDTAGRSEFFRLEASLCLTALPQLLEQTHALLTQTHAFLRGEFAGEIMSYQQQHKILAGPDLVAAECAVWLQRLKLALDGLQIPFEIPDYFRNPKAFIVSAATRFSQIDRAAQALGRTEAMQKQIVKLNWKLKEMR